MPRSNTTRGFAASDAERLCLSDFERTIPRLRLPALTPNCRAVHQQRSCSGHFYPHGILRRSLHHTRVLRKGRAFPHRIRRSRG